MSFKKERPKKIVKHESAGLVRVPPKLIRRGLDAISRRSEEISAAAAIRIICIGATKSQRSILNPIIADDPMIEFVGEASYRHQAQSLYNDTRPDVVLIFRNVQGEKFLSSPTDNQPLSYANAFERIEQEHAFEDWHATARMIRRNKTPGRMIVLLAPENDPMDDLRERLAISSGVLAVRKAIAGAELLEDIRVLAGAQDGLRYIELPDDRSVGLLQAFNKYSQGPEGENGLETSILGQAKGTFALPLREIIHLTVRYTSDFSFLCMLNPDSLDSLFLEGTNLSSSNLECLARLANLRALLLSNSSIDDRGLVLISSLSNLFTLQLNGTSISDDGVTHLTRMSALEYVGLDDTKVTSIGLAAMGELPNLTSLTIGKHQVSRSAIDAFIQSKDDRWSVEPRLQNYGIYKLSRSRDLQ